MTSSSHDNEQRDSLKQGSTQSAVPLVNAETANDLAHLLGPEVFENVVNLFVDQATSTLEAMLRTDGDEPQDDLARLAHKMKGSASTVGCESLTDLYLEIESASRNNDSERLDQLMASLRDTTRDSLNALSSFV